MKRIFTILTVLLSIQGFSQEWATIGSEWHYSQGTVNPDLISYTTIESIADTTIDGILCKKLIEVKRIYDTIAVYSHYTYSENDSVYSYEYGSFKLLYDFGAVQGDTIILGYNAYGSDSLLWIVDSTALIDVNGEERKLMHITCGDGISTEFGGKVIEGIGNLQFMFPRYDNNPYIGLRCYEDEGIGLFLNPFHPSWGWNFEDCEEILTSIYEIDVYGDISSYPNPFTTSTTIQYELTQSTHIQLTIYSHLGEAVEEAVSAFKLPGVHTYVWSAERLSEGMYFAVLRSEEGVSVVKMVKQ